jgi:hypothetical protein
VAEFNFASLSVPAVGVILVSTLLVLVSRDWRWTIAALGVQYAAVFVLVAQSWRMELAVVKLVAGWMAVAILGGTQETTRSEPERGRPSGGLFRVLAGGMVALAVFSLVPEAAVVLQEYVAGFSLPQLGGGLMLLGMGLAMLGLSAAPLRVVLALLVMFSGFEVLYAIVEDSTMVAGLLALVNLSLASIGSYLHVAPNLEAREEVR